MFPVTGIKQQNHIWTSKCSMTLFSKINLFKSIQKPLQSLAARKTVFGTHNGRWFHSTAQHSLPWHTPLNDANTLFSFSDT